MDPSTSDRINHDHSKRVLNEFYSLHRGETAQVCRARTAKQRNALDEVVGRNHRDRYLGGAVLSDNDGSKLDCAGLIGRAKSKGSVKAWSSTPPETSPDSAPANRWESNMKAVGRDVLIIISFIGPRMSYSASRNTPLGYLNVPISRQVDAAKPGRCARACARRQRFRSTSRNLSAAVTWHRWISAQVDCHYDSTALAIRRN